MCFVGFVCLSFFIGVDYALVSSYVLVFQLGMFFKFHVIGGKYAQTQRYFCAFSMLDGHHRSKRALK
jgi:hypothetical protein